MWSIHDLGESREICCVAVYFYSAGLQALLAEGIIDFEIMWKVLPALPTMRTPNSIVVCSCMYAFLRKWHPMRAPRSDGVRIGSHFHKNAYMHEQTIEFDVRIVGRKNLNWCTPLSGVSQCVGGLVKSVWIMINICILQVMLTQS